VARFFFDETQQNATNLNI